MPEQHPYGLLDTNILIHRAFLDPDHLPEQTGNREVELPI